MYTRNELRKPFLMPSVESLEYAQLTDSVTINVPEIAKKAKWLAIDVTIDLRDIYVGTADFGKLYPRIFSGYWYLLQNESIVSTGVLEFQRHRIYDKELDRFHDLLTQTYGFIADKLFSLDGNLNPFDEPTGLYARGYIAGIAGIGTINECNRIPAHRIEKLGVYIPKGVIYTIKIQWLPWCNLFTDVNNDGNLETVSTSGSLIEEILNAPLDQNDLENRSFDDLARDLGYVPSTECESLVRDTFSGVLLSNGTPVSISLEGNYSLAIRGQWSNSGQNMDGAGYFASPSHRGLARVRVNDVSVFDGSAFASDRTYTTQVTGSITMKITDTVYTDNLGVLSYTLTPI